MRMFFRVFHSHDVDGLPTFSMWKFSSSGSSAGLLHGEQNYADGQNFIYNRRIVIHISE